MTALTAERLRALLDYDPKTGVFTRRVRTAMRTWAGQKAGSVNGSGRIYIMIDRKQYLAHRLAWLHTRGVWPAEQIDHINGDPRDNRIANLRDVSRAINCQNRRTADRDNTTGYLGVSKSNGRFLARIYLTVAGKVQRRALGTFATPQLAHAAYLTAKRELHPGNTLSLTAGTGQ